VIDQDYFVAWVRAFLFTQIVEAPIYWRMLRVSWVRSVLPSTITHPIVWFVFPLLSRLGVGWLVVVGLAELFAWLVEAAFFALTGKERVPWKRALLVSFVANAASLTLGLLSREIFGGP
jgi:hypothetical protein